MGSRERCGNGLPDNGMNPIIIADAFVLTCDPSDRGGRMSMLIQDGRITDIAAESRALKTLHPEASVSDAGNLLVVPGFVNAHYHLESLFFHDFLGGKPYALWRNDPRFVERRRRILDATFEEGMRAPQNLAAALHCRNGVTTVGQIPPPVSYEILARLLKADHRLGVRTVTTLQTWEHIAQASKLKTDGTLLNIGLGPEEEYTVYTFDNLARSAVQHGLPLSAHVGEVREDLEVLRKNFKKNLGQLFHDFKILSPSLHVIHMNHANGDDLRTFANAGATVVLCPRAAAFKRTGYPALRHLFEAKNQICLGTDWVNSDMLAEMRMLHDLSFLFPGIPTFSAPWLLRMATINGATALGLADDTGSIERGKRADLTFFSLSPTQMINLGDAPGSQELAVLLLTSLHPPDITKVMAAGTVIFDSGRCTLIDEDEVAAEFIKARTTIAPDALNPEVPGRARIIPFAGPRSLQVPSAVPYEEKHHRGSAPAAALSVEGIEQNEISPSQIPELPKTSRRVPRAAVKPELSKNVRRIFGEDDETGVE